MSAKAMFSKSIVGSDAFLDMPLSAQALYFHLGMEADHDGFVGNPRRVQRSVGGNEDDLKVLIAKKFLIVFPSGVVVIKHHRINNNWDRHNCKRTTYLEEFNQIYIKENKGYSLNQTEEKLSQSGFRLETVFRREEKRREEKRREEKSGEKKIAPAPPSPLPDSLKKKKDVPEKIACGEFLNVMLTIDEKKALVDRYGFPAAKQLVVSADLYIGSTGKKYKSHYLTILSWARKDRVPERSREVKPEEVPEIKLTADQEKKMAEMREQISSMVRSKKFATQ